MKIAWLTDLHLNFLCRPSEAHKLDLRRELRLEWDPDAILVGGDTAEAESVTYWLQRIAEEFKVPVYFVLGNHDYYGSGIEEVRAEVRALASGHELLHWLPASGVVKLTEKTALVGHGGWGDGQEGDFLSSTVVLNDYLKIKDLLAAASKSPQELKVTLGALGAWAASVVSEHLEAALREFDRVIVLTHVPPFAEATWHQGSPSDDNWLPHFSCKAMGSMLRLHAAANPAKVIQVLCGHSHSAGECWPLPNLRVSTGGAAYGSAFLSVQPPILVP